MRDADGNEYLDFFGGILTVSVGHANDKVNAAIKAQVDRLSHISTLYPTLPVVELAERLARLTPGKLTPDVLHGVGHGGRRDRRDDGGALHGPVGSHRAAARLLGPLDARPVADGSLHVAPALHENRGHQARAHSVLLPLPDAPDVSLVRHRLRDRHRGASSERRPPVASRRSSPSRSRGSAASSRRRPSTSRSRSRSYASTAESSSATRSRPGSAAPGRRCGASSTGASSPRS